MENTYIDPLKIQEIKVAVDTIAIAKFAGEEYILLVKRVYDPYKGKWVIPGGFIKTDEELEDAAIRELSEETNIDAEIKEVREVGVFGKVGRDPRKRIISIAYLLLLEELPDVSGSAETSDAKWFKLSEIDSVELGFDHKEILDKAISVKRGLEE